MEYINFGKVVNVSTSVPVAANDTVYHIIIDFVPNCPEIFDSFHTDMGKILECPDDYVLCNVSDIIKAQDELLKLKDRVKELEEMNCTPVWDENQKLKDRVKELEGQLADQKKKYDKKLCEVYMETNATLYSGAYSLIAIGKELEDLKKQAEQMEELEKENQTLKVKNSELKKEKNELEKDRNTWKEKCGSVITDTFRVLSSNSFGVKFDFDGWSEDGNWLITMDFPELERTRNEAKKKIKDLEVKNGDLFKERGVLQAKLVKRCKELDELDAEIDHLKNKNRDLEKELETLKSRTLDNVEIRLSCGDIVWTYCDGLVHVSSGIDGIISADQITTGTIPKCSSCAYYVSGSRRADVWCHKPISKEGPGTIRRLSTEEAEGPACVDFKARKE